MAYIDLTICDPNPAKHFLQRRRLLDAPSIVPSDVASNIIVDFGAGGGNFTKLAAEYFDGATIFCNEPEEFLRKEAKQFLASTDNVVIVS